MKVRDDEFWSKQLAETNSTEAGKKFIDFMVLWADGAEAILKGQTEPDLSGAVQLALAAAEGQLGFLSVDLIGQMLVVLSMHWEHGPEFATALTFIERRVVEESLARKLDELQRQAAAAGVPKSKRMLYSVAIGNYAYGKRRTS